MLSAEQQVATSYADLSGCIVGCSRWLADEDKGNRASILIQESMLQIICLIQFEIGF